MSGENPDLREPTLTELVAAIINYVRADDDADGIEFIEQDKGDEADLTTVIDKAIEEIGIAVVVGVAIKPTDEGEALVVMFMGTETAITNRTSEYFSKRAKDATNFCKDRLRGWAINEEWSPFRFTDPLTLEPGPKGKVTWTVGLEAEKVIDFNELVAAKNAPQS